jgi:hypothetical protein
MNGRARQKISGMDKNLLDDFYVFKGGLWVCKKKVISFMFFICGMEEYFSSLYSS